MNNQVCINQTCMPLFYFIILIIAFIGTLLWGFYHYMMNKLGMSYNLNNNNKEEINRVKIINQLPRLSPDQMDDLAMGELPPRERDYRKINDPLKEPSRRYVTYPGGSIPGGNVNIPTQGYLPSFQLMGYLRKKGKDEPERMLKLFGRRLDTYKYEYYTTNHDDGTLKIPLNIKGDRELYDKDDIKVPGYSGEYEVTLYDYEAPKYIPYLI